MTTNSSPGITRDGFDKIVGHFGFTMKPEDAADYFELVKATESQVLEVDSLPEYIDPRLLPSSVTPASARAYSVPDKTANPLNAWSHKFELRDDTASAGGLLAGRTLAVKDTIAVAGVPLTLGTQPYHLSTDAPYPIPTIDAPVVRRVLQAGGVIKGTATCENYCMSGLSFTSATGPVENPWLPGYSAGGSSSGSAVLLAIRLVKAWREKRGLPVGDLGEGVDMTLGGDQGGSIRLPSAYSGVYGLKPTHGLVPYTGIGSLHPLVDNVGPMATSIADVAVLLSVIAGYDGIDPRCSPFTPMPSAVPAYHSLLDAAIAKKKDAGDWTPTAAGKGLRVGLLQEALDMPGLSPDVIAVIKAVAARFASLGATVVNVSAPLHSKAPAIWTAVILDSAADVFIANKSPDLLSHPIPGFDPPVPSQKWYETMTASSPSVVASLLVGKYLGDQADFSTRYRNKALSHAVQLKAAYDSLLSGPDGVDVLLLPVTPTVGPRHTEAAKMSVAERYQATLGGVVHTAPFNITGHPSLSMPGGWGPVEDGKGKLPVGIQLVGKHGNEVDVFLAGSILEVAGFGLDIE